LLKEGLPDTLGIQIQKDLNFNMSKMIENIQKGMLIGIMTLGIVISTPQAVSADVPVHTQLYRPHYWEDMVLKKKKD